jgi:hypothetical protein
MISKINKALSFKYDETNGVINAIHIIGGRYPQNAKVTFNDDALFIGELGKFFEVIDMSDECEILFAQDGIKHEIDKDGNIKITKSKK